MHICYIAQVLQAQLQGGLLLIIIHIARVIAGIVTLHNILVNGLSFLTELMFVLHGNYICKIVQVIVHVSIHS